MANFHANSSDVKFDEEILASLTNDLQTCRSYIRQVSQGMLKGNVSKYPIFVVTRSEADIDLGLPIINREEMDLTWAINASHLEDFVHHGVVSQEKVQDFIRNYKNPDEFMCIFLAEEGLMSFIFMPYEQPQSRLDVSKEQLN